MFNIRFSLGLPYGLFSQNGVDFFLKDGKLTKNKSYEFQISQFGINTILDIEIDTAWFGKDHAGPEIRICVLGFEISLKIYDHRHWNDKNNTWEIYEEETVSKQIYHTDISNIIEMPDNKQE